jgi:serine/threonine-protein kinase
MKCPVCGAEMEGEHCKICGSPPTRETLDQESEDLHVSSPLGPGDRVDERYTIVERVGEGGMGRVYKAIDRKVGRTVALKLIRPSIARSGLTRFLRELALAREVTHPNVGRVFDLGQAAGYPYISMEFVEGQSLKELIRSIGRLSPEQTVALGRQICAGLAAIHAKSIVHRDLKPANVMVDRSGKVSVMDFGVAYHQGDDHLTDAGRVVGTAGYQSPEQGRGGFTDARSDVYAVGVVLFEMLTGLRPPGDGDERSLSVRESGACPPPSAFAPDVPAELDAIVLRCLAREPGRRFASASDVETALAESEGAARRTGARRRWLWAAVLVGLSMGILYSVVHRPRQGPATLALLPLAYEGDSDNAYLKDFVPLLLGEELRALTEADVVPYSSSKSFGAGEDVRAVGRFLGVRYVVQGHLHASGGRFRATLQLKDALADKETWSQQWEGNTHDAVHGAESVARAVGSSLGLAERRALPPTTSSRAYQSYLDGRRFLEGWDVGRNMERAVASFSEATVADPSFAEAQAGLGLALTKLYQQDRQGPVLARAATATDQAVALNPSLPEGQLALGILRLTQGRAEEAAQALERAQSLAPQDDAICRSIAAAYAALGRSEVALKKYEQAVAMRPQFWENFNALGTFQLQRGALDQAKAAYREVIRLRPEADTGYTNLATTFIAAGELSDAGPLLQAALRINPDWQGHNELGVVYYATGRFEDAAREFQAAESLAPDRIEPAGNLGDAYRQLGRRDLAQPAYDKAIALGEQQLAVNPSDVEARAGVAMFLAAAGRCGPSRGHAETLESGKSTLGPAADYYLVVAYTLCGDRPRALGHAQQAIRGGAAMDMRSNPDLRDLLKEPTLRSLLNPRASS